MDLFKLIVLIALIIVLAILLLSAGRTVPAVPLVSATATALPPDDPPGARVVSSGCLTGP